MVEEHCNRVVIFVIDCDSHHPTVGLVLSTKTKGATRKEQICLNETLLCHLPHQSLIENFAGIIVNVYSVDVVVLEISTEPPFFPATDLHRTTLFPNLDPQKLRALILPRYFLPEWMCGVHYKGNETFF